MVGRGHALRYEGSVAKSPSVITRNLFFGPDRQPTLTDPVHSHAETTGGSREVEAEASEKRRDRGRGTASEVWSKCIIFSRSTRGFNY